MSDNSEYLNRWDLIESAMMTAKMFLDTCSINALSGLDDADFDLLRNKLRECQSGLYASHIQVDERHPHSKELYTRAFDKFKKHGIRVHWINPTRGMVIGISRIGFCKISEDELAEIGKKLEDEVRRCMEGKPKFKNKSIDEQILNIARDCLIAITSLDYDYFITSDRCLYKSWDKILQEDETRKILEYTPNIVYAQPHKEEILRTILKILN